MAYLLIAWWFSMAMLNNQMVYDHGYIIFVIRLCQVDFPGPIFQNFFCFVDAVGMFTIFFTWVMWKTYLNTLKLVNSSSDFLLEWQRSCCEAAFAEASGDLIDFKKEELKAWETKRKSKNKKTLWISLDMDGNDMYWMYILVTNIDIVLIKFNK